MTCQMIVQDEFDLHDGLIYEPNTGIMTRDGKVVGTPDKDGYLRVRYYGELTAVHVLGWAFEHGFFAMPPEIDHVDRVKDHNWIGNLRPSTRRENNLNVGVRSDNESGFKGVGWHAGRGKWRARARVEGKRVELGYYDTPEEAYSAYVAFDPTRAA